MCDASGCALESVAFVEIVFPADASIDASWDDGVDRGHPVAVQRLGYCIVHGAEQGLTNPVTSGRAVKGARGKGKFPAKHALAADWTWAVN